VSKLIGTNESSRSEKANIYDQRYMSKNDPDVEPEAVMVEEELDPVSLMDVEPYLD
jgi:hypothetical protein